MADFQGLLYKWYKENQRILPWRETSDPYRIWVSEIILQQTRVSQGFEYYKSFIERFPDIESLANADEDRVLKAWQGLGYYSRARNMHQAAKTILGVYNGIFPSDYDKIIRLKGIGTYTSAAIASIAFGKPIPVLDGNVYRFFSRYYSIDLPIDTTAGKKYFSFLAGNLIDRENPGQFNQAVMEFGALKCLPRNPGCPDCIFRDTCLAYRQGRVLQFPVKTKKSKPRSRFFNYFLIEKDSALFLQKRTGNDIWKNLYQFPLFESNHDLTPEEVMSAPDFQMMVNGKTIVIKRISRSYKHILTHQIIYARFFHLLTGTDFHLSGEYMEVLRKDIHKFAVPRLIEIYLNENEPLIPDD